MNKQLLEDSIEMLKSIRAESLISEKNAVVDELDLVIEKLQIALVNGSPEYSVHDVLDILNKVLGFIPAVILIVEKLKELG